MTPLIEGDIVYIVLRADYPWDEIDMGVVGKINPWRVPWTGGRRWAPLTGRIVARFHSEHAVRVDPVTRDVQLEELDMVWRDMGYAYRSQDEGAESWQDEKGIARIKAESSDSGAYWAHAGVARLVAEIDRLRAQETRLRAALDVIGEQKMTAEISYAEGLHADFEGAYDTMIETARAVSAA